MSEPSPRPWRIELSIGDWASCVADAKGDHVASCYGNQWRAEANALLVVDAVNSYAIKSPCRVCAGYAQKGGCIADERDHLRDIVRRLSRHLANYITSESENDLLREARAAIGENKP